MKVLLMHRDRDLDMAQELPWNAAALRQDLELNRLLEVMAGPDKFVFAVASQVLLSGLANDAATILYRQANLRDALQSPAVIRDLYHLATEVMDRRQKKWFGFFSRYPSGILYDAIDLMEMFVGMLRRLRRSAQEHAGLFSSEGFTAFFARIERELDEAYLARIQEHLEALKFHNGVPLSAQLGENNEGANYVLHPVNARRPNWLQRLAGFSSASFTFRLHPRDEAGARILSEIRDRGINLAANALAQSAEHILSFVEMLRSELAFYVGCLNLHDRLLAKGEPTCFPTPAAAGERRCRFRGLYDPCLALRMAGRVVGNTADADSRDLVVITGANHGGKSVFLRSVGLAQLMMQCGMFVAAESFTAELCTGLCTHYRRPEDPTMRQGKLDEELGRMSEIAEHLSPQALLLCNESFAATNEREGSEIARQIVMALVEKRIKVFFVTHLYEFTHGLYTGMAAQASSGRASPKGVGALFLRAERLADGTRTFRIREGEPLQTSYGEDVYRQVFAADFAVHDESACPRGLRQPNPEFPT